MARLLDHIPELLEPGLAPADEAAARRTLRAQIARLERELSATAITAMAPAGASRAGPRLLGLGELEELRDELSERLRRARLAVARRADEQDRSRVLLERMRLEPRAHKYVRVTSADLGEPGCWSWHVRPRLGLLGMLMGWWEVKLSSGCPLACVR